MKRISIVAISALVVACGMMAGCRVEEDKHGDSKDVRISTPFGGMRVRTNDADVLETIGLALYPGATPEKKDNDDGAADVDMNFGGYQLRVKRRTTGRGDSEDKVEAFYRNELKKYGDVIACNGTHTVGTPVKTLAGLTCANSNGQRIQVNVNDDPGKSDLELKTGSKLHQHVVGMSEENGGTKIALVVLDLPGSGDDGDNTK